MTKITVSLNGPLKVDSPDATLVDWNGADLSHRRRARSYLCRCGASTNKPFCDGTHSKMGFKAAEAAVPGSVDKPAQ